jgi:hypothetical protein
MRTLGVIMIGVGVLLCWEAWESHKNQTAPTPIQHARAAISGQTASTGTPTPDPVTVA